VTVAVVAAATAAAAQSPRTHAGRRRAPVPGRVY